MKIDYQLVANFIGWSKTEDFVKDLILKNKLNSVLEIGAGANPTIHPEFINKYNLKYTISDVDDNELKKADEIYSKLVIDLSSPDFYLSEKFDLVFSRMVGEHISDAKKFHQNVFNILNSGGISFHCFSTLYTFPFVVNKILPDGLSNIILGKIAPRDSHQHGKFKAHYDWSYGPSKKMIKRFENIGYEIVEYVGYFGHSYYKKFSILNKLEELKSKLLLKFPLPLLTSYSHFILMKP